MRLFNYRGEDTNRYCNTMALEIGDLTVFFSYETPVAFFDGTQLCVTDEFFSRTSEQHKHASESYCHKKCENRWPSEIFNHKLEMFLKKEVLKVE